MTDYSFSSAGRKKKLPKKSIGESSDSRDALPTGPAHETPTPQSTNDLSVSARSASSGGSKVKDYIASLNSSTWPSPKLSSSVGPEKETNDDSLNSENKGKAVASGKAETTKSGEDNGPKNIKTIGSLTTQKSMSSNDSESDSGSNESGDSELLAKKTIDKYRKKYLDGDDDNGNNTKNGDERKLNLPDRDANGTTYDKYRQKLNESKGSEDKWGVPTTKLGAAPTIDYNYRYSSAPKRPSKENKPITPDTKPKLEKVKLKSSKIDKDDLGILASMLGDDDSASESPSEGIFSTNSYHEGANAVDTQRRGEESEDQGSVHSSESSYEEEVIEELTKEDDDEIPHKVAKNSFENPDSFSESQSKVQSQLDEVSATKGIERGRFNAVIHPDTSMHQGEDHPDNRVDSVRNVEDKSEKSDGEKVYKLCDEITPGGGNDSSKNSESPRESKSPVQRPLNKTRAIKESERAGSDAAIPPETIMCEDEVQQDLGKFLDNRIDSKRIVKDKSERSGGDDFSAIWAQSVASEAKSRGRARQNGDDDSDNHAATVEESQLIEEVVEDSSESTVEASNSTSSKNDSSGGIGSSLQLGASDNFKKEASPPTSVPSSGIHMQYDKSSSESDSDGSLDFDNLTGLEKYTTQDSKNSSRKLESETPVMSNRKLAKSVDVSQKSEDKRKVLMAVSKEGSEDKRKALMAVSKEGSEDKRKALMSVSKEGSDGSLDAFDFAQPLPQKKEKKTDTPDNDEESESMSDFSLNPSKDLVEEKSQSEYDKPEYRRKQEGKPGRDLDLYEAFQTLDVGSLVDVEAPTSEGSKSVSKHDQVEAKAKPASSHRKPIYSTGCVRHIGRAWVALAFFASIGLPIYFFVFLDYDDEGGQPPSPLDMFPVQPIFTPTIAPIAPPTVAPVPIIAPIAPPTVAPVPTIAPIAPPTVAPVSLASPAPVRPTLRPTLVKVTATPTLSPTRSRISYLREFLVSVWPSLEDDFVGFETPQFIALDWLANNENYDDYSDDQKIQRFALATFFLSTRGDRWRRNDLWLSNEDECTWYSGNTESPCDESGSYIRLDLDLNNLSGTIPAEVGLLSNLSEIGFSKAGSSASLSSTIPSEIGLLANLVDLNLRGNGITGSLPTELGNCVNVQNLDISFNLLSGIIPTQMAALDQLQSLNLASNGISDVIPSTIGWLRRLESLQLDNNLLSGKIPSEIGFLSLLSTINLDGNVLTSLPSQIGNLVSLQHFSAANNQLQGPLPSEIGGLEGLRRFQLENNNLTGTIPSALGKLIELRDTLDLSKNQFSGQVPTELGRLIFLRNIVLNNNQLSGGVPDSFSSLLRLGVLRLESNNLSGVVSDTVCSVFNQTYPVFTTDCANPVEIACTCCMYCCEDLGDCICQYANTELDFLCSEVSRSSGLEARIDAN